MKQMNPMKGVSFTLLLISLLMVPGYAIKAQSQEVQKGTTDAVDDEVRRLKSAPAATTTTATATDVEQLKEKLKQLERTVAELKQQIDAVEKPQKASAAGTGETISAPVDIPATAATPR